MGEEKFRREGQARDKSGAWRESEEEKCVCMCVFGMERGKVGGSDYLLLR